MKCAKCNKEFEEKDMHISHDVPKYLGGTDLGGRHWLCHKCHFEYDKIILIRCLKFVGEELADDSEIPFWMKELSRQPERLKEEFRKIAREVKKEWWT